MRRHLCWFSWVVLQGAMTGCGGEMGGPDENPIDPGGAGAEKPGEAVFAPEEPTELWFVEFHGSPSARGGAAVMLGDERNRFKQSVASLGLRYKERLSFNRLWNGLSVQMREGAAGALASLPEVKAIYPVVPIQLDDAPPSDSGSTPELYTALSMTGADIVHSQLGFTGHQVKVGVIDSGIDYDHPDLGGCFGEGCRVAYGYDFVGDAYNADISSQQPVPDPYPDDCGGHGSHVAGIIGADGAVIGVAPDVTFGAYRVFGCSGSTSSDIMIQAMERAEADGMRVINMSIGSPFQWPSYPTAMAANQLVEDGVVVVTSIGNSGTSGLYAAGAPGVGDLVIGSASIENTAIAGPAFAISPDPSLIGFKKATGAPSPPLSGSAPIRRTSPTPIDGDGCVNPPAPGSLTGAIALIRRGSPPPPAPSCSFYAKAKAAQDAGAVGVVIYNNQSGTVSPTVVGTPPITIPVVMISSADGALVNARMNQGEVTHSWTDQTTSATNSLANQVSSFSSYGITATLSMKPDIAAPGGNIWSTYPLELGGYESLSGTSMASPHVTGTVALLLEARPGVAATEVRDILENSAVPVEWTGALGTGTADQSFRQGAGIVQIDRAILATTRIRPGKLALGESDAGPFHGTLTLTNEAGADVSYDVSHTPAPAAGGDHWAPTGNAGGYAAVQFSAPAVTVPAHGAATVDVTITADAGLANGNLYGGYLVFTQQGGSSVLRVPYGGFKGDYQSLQVLTPADQGYPWLALWDSSANPPKFVKQPKGRTFTLQSGDVPYVLVHYDHHASRMTLNVYGASTMKPYGSARDFVNIGQSSANSGTSAYSSYSWNGMVTLNKKTSLVPNGQYVLKLSVLKALGDEANPAHWETWTSPVVTINHP